MCLLGVSAVGSLGSEREMAALGLAKPSHISTVEIVKMLLKITFPAETNGVVVQEAHGALIFLRGWCDMPRRRVRGDIA